MKTWLTIGWMALACLRTGQASEFRITSFERNGRLTFQEVPAASSYRVEWTASLISPAWSSNPPGIAAIPALGFGTLTATVGVSHASCFYRVVAAVTNPPPTPITNTFDLSTENWRIVDYPFRSHRPNPATTTLPFDGSFGNPPGSIRVGDVYFETGVAAPAPYLGDKAAYYGGSLWYDIYLRYTDNVAYPGVVLNGGTVSVYYDAASPPLNGWQRRTVPLSEIGWKVSGSGATATETVFRAVLSNLVGLYIYTEWHTGTDDTNIDNVGMAPP